jgi:PTH1 family peptidyl-tRNA hydrolase
LEQRWLIAGLGNPGEEYQQTPHNLGFLVVDRLAERHQVRVTRPEEQALVGLGYFGSTPVVLVKPQTYMNLSGLAVAPLMERYGIPPERLVVVYDDLDLPWTAVRIRAKGSAGGHHGMESVIRYAGTTEFPRVRLGIDTGVLAGGGQRRDGAKIVLGRFSREQREELDELLDYASRAVEAIIAEGVEKAMTAYNRRARGSKEEEE